MKQFEVEEGIKGERKRESKVERKRESNDERKRELKMKEIGN